MLHVFVHAGMMQSVWIRFIDMCFSKTVFLSQFLIWLGADLKWDTVISSITNIPVPAGVSVGYGCTLAAGSSLASTRMQDGVLISSSLHVGNHVSLEEGTCALPGSRISSCVRSPPHTLVFSDQYWCEKQESQRMRDDIAQLKCGLELDAGLAGAIAAAEVKPSSVDHILLTGSTGFLGAQLLFELLTSRPSCIVHCLVRGGSSKTDAFGRILKELRARQLWRSEFISKIVVVQGVLQQPGLGLGTDEYVRLASRITGVVHCAARVHWLHSYSALRETNVIGTINMIRFAHTAQRIRAKMATAGGKEVSFHYISTVGATSSCTEDGDNVMFDQLCRYRADLISSNATEKPSTRSTIDGLSAAHTAVSRLQYRTGMAGYASSKWMGELLLRSAVASEGFRCRVSIYRPALIAPHSVTSFCKRSDFIPRYLLGSVELGGQLDTPDMLDLITVDSAAKIIIAVGQRTEQRTNNGAAASQVETYHIANGLSSPRFSDLLSVLAATPQCSSAIHPMNFISWMDRIQSYGPSGALFTLISFLQEQRPRKAPFDMTNVRSTLFATSIITSSTGMDFSTPLARYTSAELSTQYMQPMDTNMASRVIQHLQQQ